MRLQDRDKILLQLLYRFGVMSTRQIADRIFSNIALTTVLRRLRVLQDDGLIINSGHLPDGTKVWSISKTGAQAIGNEDVFRFTNQNTLNHDVCLTEARFALEGMSLGYDWTSESELKRNLSHYKQGRALVPDGIFVAEVSEKNQVVSFELELTPKSHARYKNIFTEYCHMDGIGVIWYVVKDISITKPILKQWLSVKANSRIKPQQALLFTKFDDLICNGRNAEVIDESGQLKSISEHFKTSQGQSSFLGAAMSRSDHSDPKSNQQDNSAPEFPKCAFRPRPLPLHMRSRGRGRGLQAQDKSGSGGSKGKGRRI